MSFSKSLRATGMVLILLVAIVLRGNAGYSPKISLNEKSAPISKVFREIERQSGYRFFYQDEVLKLSRPVTIRVENQDIQQVLESFFKAQPLDYNIVQKTVIVKAREVSAAMKESMVLGAATAAIQISGRVTGEDGTPLEGATITEKGTRNAVASGADGYFRINVREGAVLVFVSLGYDTREAPATPNMDIRLQRRDQVVSEVVVTALGIRKEKEKISYATQEVKGAVLEKAPQPNVVENLVGRVAGLNILTKTNLFENPEIKLRGANTLVVIDGVPTDNNNFDFWSLNPNDIENVNVLKGTAAAALYGSLGINGAIMITTKKGKSGAKGIEVSVNSTTQFQAGYTRMPDVQSQYGMGWNGTFAFINGKGANGGYDDYGYVWGPKLNQQASTPSGFVEYPQYNSPYDANTNFAFTEPKLTGTSHYKPLPAITRGANNVSNFLRNEFITTNNVSVAGKGDNSDYRISMTHMYQKGQIPNTQLNSTTISLAGSLRPTDKLRLEATLAYNKQYTPNFPQTGYGANNFFYNLLLWMGPDVDVRDLQNYWQPAGGRASGSTFIPYGVRNIQQFNYNYTWYNNPYFQAYENLNGYVNDVITGQLNASYDFTKDLTLFARTGVITNNAEPTQQYAKSTIYYGATQFAGNYIERRLSNFQIVTDVLLTYKKNFSNGFGFTASVGASNRYNNNSYLADSTNGLNVPANYNLANSVGPISSGNRKAERNVNSVFGYVDMDYKKMIYVGLTGRNDATSTLQKPNNSYFYPSANVGLVLSNMFKFPGFVSYAKLRGAWAQVSTDNVNVAQDQSNIYRNWYATIPVYQTGPRWNGSTASLNLPGTLIQPDIRPNTTLSQEYGAEVRFLNNRLGVDFTYFSYIDKDFAINAPVSNASGYTAQLVNGDKINRRGYEVTLSGTPVRTRDFKWDIVANYSTVHSYVKEYYGGATIRNAVKVGERTDIYRAYDWQYSPDHQIVIQANGKRVYSNGPVNIGLTDADFIFGISNTFSYKNFSLSFAFDGRVGGIMFNGLEQKLYEGGMHPGTANSYRDDAYAGNKTYVAPGVVVTSGSVTYDVQGNITSDTRKFAPNTTKVSYIDDIFDQYVDGIPGANIYKRTFAKLREVVLTYNFTPALLRKTPFSGANISITGRNLLLFTAVPFMDPDGYNETQLAEPTYRNIGININLKF